MAIDNLIILHLTITFNDRFMYKEVLKKIIVEGQRILTKIEAVERDFVFEPNARYVFVGVRQAGKSYELYIRAKQLLNQGHSPEEMLFVNFDDERLSGMQSFDLDQILQAYSSLYSYEPIIFLDEIQNIDGWEKFARRLANQKYQTYITGSNAKMLSRDIATTLGARYIEQYVFPYSFKEFLHANNVLLSANWEYDAEIMGVVERKLSEYFEWGGFPEVLKFIEKRKWLNELYEKIVLADIIARNKIKNEKAIRTTFRRLAENIKNPTSYNRLMNMVKATGISTNTTSVMEYVRMAIDACFLFTLTNYASKFVERETVKKHYFIDNGLLNIFLVDSETSLFENICALKLYRDMMENPDEKVYFYNKEVEIDFYIHERKHAIQACYSLKEYATELREVKAIETFYNLYGLNSAEIVTYSEEREIELPSLTIKVMPLAKWLLKK